MSPWANCDRNMGKVHRPHDRPPECGPKFPDRWRDHQGSRLKTLRRQLEDKLGTEVVEQVVEQAGKGAEELVEEAPQVIVYEYCCWKVAKCVDGSCEY